jgi:tyrosine-protein phosphatase SIW14
MARRSLLLCLKLLLVALAILTPVEAARWLCAQTPNVHVVRDGVLYRSGQMSLFGMRRTLHDLGIRTVVNFRYGVQPLDRAEEELCHKEEVTFVRIPPLSWDGVQGTAEVDAGVARFLEVIRNPKNYPILIHCFGGVHRTGAYTAIYRMEREGWSNARAIAEMKAHGYATFEEELDIRGYLTSYRPGKTPEVCPVCPPQ